MNIQDLKQQIEKLSGKKCVLLTEDQIDMVSAELAEANAAEREYIEDTEMNVDSEEKATLQEGIDVRDEIIAALHED